MRQLLFVLVLWSGLCSASPYLAVKGSAWRLAMARAGTDPGSAAQLVYGAYDGAVRVADAATGKLLWEAALDGFPFAVAAGNLDGVAGDEVLAATAGGSIYAFNGRGKMLWRYRTPYPVYNVAVGIDAAKQVFVAAGGIGHKVYLLNGTGKLRATHDLTVLVHRLMTADFDGDGASEILAVDQRSTVELLEAEPAALRQVWRKDLQVPESYRNWENPRGLFFAFSVAAADLNGDKRPEMLFGDTYFNKQAVLATGGDGAPLWITPPLPQGMGDWRRVASYDRWYEFYSTAWVTTGEAVKESAGPEVIVVTGGNLRIFSAAGKLLRSAESALAFTDAIVADGVLYLGSTPNGDETVYRLPLDGQLTQTFAGLERQGMAKRIGDNLDLLRTQVLGAKAVGGRSESRHAVQMLGAVSSEQAAQRTLREMAWLREQFPYSHLQPVAGLKALEPTPPLNPEGKPWNPRRWQTDSINGTQTVEQIVEAARRVERLGIPTLFNIGHSCMPFVTLETVRKILAAAPTMTEGFLSAEDENPVEFPVFAKHYLAPLADLALAGGGKKVMTKNKGVWWFSMPAEPAVSKDLLVGERSKAFVSTTEDSNSRTPEINLMARVGLRQAGLVPRMRASIHQDLFSFNRFHQWEHPRSGHPYLRLLVAHAVLGAADFEFRISDRLTAGEQPGFALLGRESTEIFLHLLGKDLVVTPRPDQMAGLSTVGIAVHPTSAKFKADAHNGHAPQNWVPDAELENGVLPLNGCLWGLTETAPHAITRVLFGKRRQFGYFVPPTPYGAVAMVPATADLNKVKGVKEWWHTDGIYLWRTGGQKLTGMAAATALRASLEAAASGLAFRAAGDDVFLQAIELEQGKYRLYAIDPGWLDPKERRIRITRAGTYALRDLLTGESIPVSKGVAEVVVPAGSLRILEAVTVRRPQ